MSFPVWSRRNKGNFELLEAEILTFIAFHCHAPEKVSRLIFEQKAQQVTGAKGDNAYNCPFRGVNLPNAE